ncbi:cation diffusion facilitator family transporter [Fusibacter bizertensis]
MSGHNHSHEIEKVSGKKIFWVTVLNATITITEVIGGLLSGSLALLSDSVHNLSDTIAIALSFFANKIAQKPKNIRKTYGYKRAEILAAFFNSSILFVISTILIFEAYKRFKSPELINGTLMISIAIIGLLANFISVYLLKKDAHENLNIKSSYLHLMSDTVSSIGVVLGGIVIKLWNVTWIDPVITILISLYILRETWHIIKNTVDILMQSSPDLNYDEIKRGIEGMDKVINIHHVHAWMINEKTIHFEAHIDMEDVKLSEVEKVYEEIEHFLIDHHGVSHITIQPEVNRCCDKEVVAK